MVPCHTLPHLARTSARTGFLCAPQRGWRTGPAPANTHTHTHTHTRVVHMSGCCNEHMARKRKGKRSSGSGRGGRGKGRVTPARLPLHTWFALRCTSSRRACTSSRATRLASRTSQLRVHTASQENQPEGPKRHTHAAYRHRHAGAHAHSQHGYLMKVTRGSQRMARVHAHVQHWDVRASRNTNNGRGHCLTLGFVVHGVSHREVLLGVVQLAKVFWGGALVVEGFPSLQGKGGGGGGGDRRVANHHPQGCKAQLRQPGAKNKGAHSSTRTCSDGSNPLKKNRSASPVARCVPNQPTNNDGHAEREGGEFARVTGSVKRTIPPSLGPSLH